MNVNDNIVKSPSINAGITNVNAFKFPELTQVMHNSDKLFLASDSDLYINAHWAENKTVKSSRL